LLPERAIFKAKDGRKESEIAKQTLLPFLRTSEIEEFLQRRKP